MILILAVAILWPAPRRFREGLANDQQRQLAQQAIEVADKVDWKAIRDMAVADLQAYIRLPTVNPPGNTKAAAEWLAGRLQAEGISAQIDIFVGVADEEVGGELGVKGWLLQRLSWAPMRWAVLPRLKKDPLVAATLQPTASWTGLNSGVKYNVIPGHAEALLDMRMMPGMTPEGTLK